MRCKAAKQTMAVEPESLPCSLAGLERHVGRALTLGEGCLQHGERAACMEGPQERPGIWAKVVQLERVEEQVGGWGGTNDMASGL